MLEEFDPLKVEVMVVIAQMRMMRQVFVSVGRERIEQYRRAYLADTGIVSTLCTERGMTAFVDDVVQSTQPRADEQHAHHDAGDGPSGDRRRQQGRAETGGGYDLKSITR